MIISTQIEYMPTYSNTHRTTPLTKLIKMKRSIAFKENKIAVKLCDKRTKNSLKINIDIMAIIFQKKERNKNILDTDDKFSIANSQTLNERQQNRKFVFFFIAL